MSGQVDESKNLNHLVLIHKQGQMSTDKCLNHLILIYKQESVSTDKYLVETHITPSSWMQQSRPTPFRAAHY